MGDGIAFIFGALAYGLKGACFICEAVDFVLFVLDFNPSSLDVLIHVCYELGNGLQLLFFFLLSLKELLLLGGQLPLMQSRRVEAVCLVHFHALDLLLQTLKLPLHLSDSRQLLVDRLYVLYLLSWRQRLDLLAAQNVVRHLPLHELT